MQWRLLVRSLWEEDTSECRKDPNKFPSSNSSKIFFQKNHDSHCWRARCRSKWVALVGCYCKLHERKSTTNSLSQMYRRSRKSFCGATLISDTHVITAAHCVDKYAVTPNLTLFAFGRFKSADLRVRVGEYSFEHVIILKRINFIEHTPESIDAYFAMSDPSKTV